MKLRFPKLMFLLSAILLPACALLGENFLPNGSFEAGRFGWYLHSQFNLGSRIEVVKGESKFGERSLRLERTSEVGSVWLVHEFVKLEPGKDHTFSVWLRSESDALPATLRIGCYDGAVIGKWVATARDVKVGKEWNRYELTWKTPPAAMGMYLPRIEINAPGVLYVDGVQIEEGPASDFTPKAALELGLSPSREDSLYHLKRKVDLSILAANSGSRERRLNVSVALSDYNDQKVMEKRLPLVAEAGKTGEVVFDLTLERLGYYRAEVQLLDEKGVKIAQARWAFAVIPEAPEKPDVKFGICMERENIEAQVALARKLGIGAVRLHNTLLWGNTEKEKGKFTWDEEMPAIRAVREAGMEPLVYLMTVPQWALDPEKSKTNPGGFPRELADYALAVKETVRVCKEWMRDWEIVNESPGWYEPGAYFSLLKAAYEGAKEADPNCTVVGICGFVNDEKLMPYVLEQGGLNYMDVLSIHPYSVFGSTPEKGFPTAWEWVRRLMRKHGEEKPIWSTEFGWRATDWPLLPDFEGARTDVDEKTQADYLVRSHVISYASGVKRFYYFLLATRIYGGPYTNNIFVGDSLTSPKKAVAALASMTKMLSGLDFHERWDTGSDNIWALRFADDNRQVIVAWAPYEVDFLLMSGEEEGIKVYDLFGNEIPLVTVSGMAKVTLSPSPVYIEARRDAAIKPEPILKVSPLEKIDPEETQVVEVTLAARNLFAEAISGQLTVILPKGWESKPQELLLILKPGESREVKFRIKPWAGFAEPYARIRFELRDGSKGIVLAAAERAPDFRPGPPPKPKHSIWIEAEAATEKDVQFLIEKGDRAYGRAFLHLETTVKPPAPPGYFSAKIPLSSPKGGDFTLLMIGNPLNVAFMSPLWWRIDSGEWRKAWDLPQQGEVWTPWPQTGDNYKFFGTTNLGKVRLEAGEHILELRIDETRQINPWYTLYADAFALVEENR